MTTSKFFQILLAEMRDHPLQYMVVLFLSVVIMLDVALFFGPYATGLGSYVWGAACIALIGVGLYARTKMLVASFKLRAALLDPKSWR